MLALRILWVGFFGFGAIAALKDEIFFGAILCLTASAVGLPQTWRLLAERGLTLTNGKKVSLSIAFGLIALFVCGLGFQNTPEGKARAIEAKRVAEVKAKQEAADEEAGSPYADKAQQQLWIVKSQEAITARLKDPDSVKFRNVGFYSGGSAPVACGEVNAKNGFGGYTGFERFIASGTKLAVLASDMQSPTEMQSMWAKLCVKAKTDG